jgi:hypothetical protein
MCMMGNNLSFQHHIDSFCRRGPVLECERLWLLM